MKGVVLAGGKGTRLKPMTNVINKHLLPVYDEPEIYYPVNTLVDSGIDEILVVSNAESIGKYIELIEQEDFDADFSYKVQKNPRGIAHAVSLAEDFVDGRFAVMLGDNIVLDDLSDEISEFETSEYGSKIFLKEVSSPARYGLAEVSNGSVTALEEKPDDPSSNLAVIGLYLYDESVFNKISNIEPSERGEYEITDVNDLYMKGGKLTYATVDGKWFDAGTPEGLLKASKHAREYKHDE